MRTKIKESIGTGLSFSFIPLTVAAVSGIFVSAPSRLGRPPRGHSRNGRKKKDKAQRGNANDITPENTER